MNKYASIRGTNEQPEAEIKPAAVALPVHLQSLARKLEDRGFRYQAAVTDVTPDGYGPTNARPGSGITVEKQRLLTAIAEGETLLRGSPSPEKRSQIERAVLRAKYAVKAMDKAEHEAATKAASVDDARGAIAELIDMARIADEVLSKHGISLANGDGLTVVAAIARAQAGES